MSQEFEPGLKNLEDLHKKGYIDDVEFEKRKSGLVDKITGTTSTKRPNSKGSRRKSKGSDNAASYSHASSPRPAVGDSAALGEPTQPQLCH